MSERSSACPASHRWAEAEAPMSDYEPFTETHEAMVVLAVGEDPVPITVTIIWEKPPPHCYTVPAANIA